MTISELLRGGLKTCRNIEGLRRLVVDPPPYATVHAWVEHGVVPRTEKNLLKLNEMLEKLGYGPETIRHNLAQSRSGLVGPVASAEKWMLFLELESLTLTALADQATTRTGCTIGEATAVMQNAVVETRFKLWQREKHPRGVHRPQHGRVLLRLVRKLAADADPAYAARFQGVIEQAERLGISGTDLAWVFSRTGH